MIQKGNATLLQRFQKDYFAADVDRSQCLRHQTLSFARTTLGTWFITNFSYRLDGKNVKVMLEFELFQRRQLGVE